MTPFDRLHTSLFRDETRYWRKLWFFFIPHLHLTPPLGGPRQNIVITFGTEKLEWCVYQSVEKVWEFYVYAFRYNRRSWRTDGRTDGMTDTARRYWCIMHSVDRATKNDIRLFGLRNTLTRSSGKPISGTTSRVPPVYCLISTRQRRWSGQAPKMTQFGCRLFYH